MPYSTARPFGWSTTRRIGGFTLIEIIVAITIIAILAGLGLVVGRRVTESGRSDVTRNLLKSLEATQTSYASERDSAIPFKYTDTSNQKNEFAIFDGRIDATAASDTLPAEPSLALYLLAVDGAPSVKSAIGGIDTRFIARAQFQGDYASSGPKDLNRFYVKGADAPSDTNSAITTITVKDPWGHPIRYVHPKFAGGYGDFFKSNGSTYTATTRASLTSGVKVNRNGVLTTQDLRRSFRPFDPSAGSAARYGDADEGLTTGGNGYFYSVGGDGDPGKRADNVYTTTPKFPSETERAE